MSRGKLEGKVALVTGGGTGIGRATALGLAAEGASVCVVGRRGAPLAATARTVARRGGSALAVAADVATLDGAEDAVVACRRRFRRLDVLVNNAGCFAEGSVESVDPETWRRVMAVNLDAVYYMARFALPMLKRRGGVIVNVSSTLGSRGLPGAAAYCAAKGGVENLTRAMALDHAVDGVRVVAVAPGVVETAMGLRGDRRTDPARRLDLHRLHPLGRMGRPVDVAAMIVQLCRPESAWITGSIVVLDGGLTARG